MSIGNLTKKSKQVGEFITRDDIFIALLIIFVGLGAFGLGRLSVEKKTSVPITIQQAFPGESGAVAGESVSAVVSGEFVGSRNGTKYHYPWCPGAQQMKEENKVWFSTREEAESRGYTPAANCSGL